MPLLPAEIREVGNDEVKRPPTPAEEIPTDKMHIPWCKPIPVNAGHPQRGQRAVTSNQEGRGLSSERHRERDNNRSTTGAHVDAAWPVTAQTEALSCPGDQVFGFRAGNERRWSDEEVEAIKLAMASEVGDRFPSCSPFDEFPEAVERDVKGQWESAIQLGAIDAEDVTKQDFRIETR